MERERGVPRHTRREVLLGKDVAFMGEGESGRISFVSRTKKNGDGTLLFLSLTSAYNFDPITGLSTALAISLSWYVMTKAHERAPSLGEALLEGERGGEMTLRGSTCRREVRGERALRFNSRGEGEGEREGDVEGEALVLGRTSFS
jgi:hypothetical protein